MTRVLALVVVALFALPGAALASRQTTNPGLAPVTIYVIVTDKGIKYTCGRRPAGGQPTLSVAQALLRGEVAIFDVKNKGKKPHNFVAFGKKTPTLRPGGHARFKVALIRRGKFPFQSTLDKGKRAFRGVLKGLLSASVARTGHSDLNPWISSRKCVPSRRPERLGIRCGNGICNPGTRGLGLVITAVLGS